MTVLEVAGIAVPVPPGWEARARSGGGVDGGGVAYPYLHLATVAMPASRAAYGGGVVERLGPNDCFAALVAFAPSAAGTTLFAARGLPRRLRAASFTSSCLQRTIPRQLGHQHFFSEAGRALCLYVVMGGAGALAARLPALNRALADAALQRAVPA